MKSEGWILNFETLKESYHLDEEEQGSRGWRDPNTT